MQWLVPIYLVVGCWVKQRLMPIYLKIGCWVMAMAGVYLSHSHFFCIYNPPADGQIEVKLPHFHVQTTCRVSI